MCVSCDCFGNNKGTVASILNTSSVVTMHVVPTGANFLGDHFQLRSHPLYLVFNDYRPRIDLRTEHLKGSQ